MTHNEPATAYAYRRAIALVEVLALDNPYPGIQSLCAQWDVKQVRATDLHFGDVWDVKQTIFALAQHALVHAREKK